MRKHQEEEITRDEVRKEFQLERMTLFSDAVFAIVMTLMAIEIRLPEHGAEDTTQGFIGSLIHLIPILVAYAVSFGFIGAMWYNHLKIFSLLKDYDKGLVTRNLIFLFFLGLFPFSATLVSKIHNDIQIPLFIYLGVIILCRIAQFMLHDYIFMRRPELRINSNIDKELAAFKKDRFSLVWTVIAFLLTGITNVLIGDPHDKIYSILWVFLHAIALKIYKRRNADKKQLALVTQEVE
jgi:uncharacterized membrane protein